MPFPLLDAERFNTTVGNPGADIYEYDVVFAHRLAGRSEVWDKLCADPDVLTVYDMDDDLLCVDRENTVPYRIFAPLVEATRRNVEQADIVTVPNEALAERYRHINPNVAVLPICIPDDLPGMLWPIHNGPLTVGWAGSMHKGQDWAPDDVAGKLAQFARLQPDVWFHMMGCDYTRNLLRGRCRFTPFTLDPLDYYRALDFDIGIAPLMDSPFNAGKSHTKLIEYGARGIPTIASAIGQNVEWIDHGVNGFLVRDPGEWVPYLLALTDDETRAAMAFAAYDSAKAWSIGQHIHKWEDVFST